MSIGITPFWGCVVTKKKGIPTELVLRRVPDALSAGLRARARSEGYGRLFLSSGFAVTDGRSSVQLRFGCCASGTKRNAVCAFMRVLAKTEPLSAGLRARVRWDGHGQLFSASGIVDTTRAPANIDARDGAAFHLNTLMVEWPELGRNFRWRERKPRQRLPPK